MPEEQQTQTAQPATPQVVASPQGVSWSKIIITVIVIVVVTALIAGAYWYFVLNKSTGEVDTTPIKVSTPSAKKATESAKKSTGSATTGSKVITTYLGNREETSSGLTLALLGGSFNKEYNTNNPNSKQNQLELEVIF